MSSTNLFVTMFSNISQCRTPCLQASYPSTSSELLKTFDTVHLHNSPKLDCVVVDDITHYLQGKQVNGGYTPRCPQHRELCAISNGPTTQNCPGCNAVWQCVCDCVRACVHALMRLTWSNSVGMPYIFTTRLELWRWRCTLRTFHYSSRLRIGTV